MVEHEQPIKQTITSFTEKTKLVKTTIEKTDAIIIGAGSGLSTAAGLLCDDFDTFNTWFPSYYEHYGLRSINEAIFYQFLTSEEQYAYWIRHISATRYILPVGKPYLDLYRIIRDKNYFILTTNTDGQFLKSGFESDKICSPQGDLAYFQCSRPCNDELYPNEQTIKQILSHITGKDFAIPTADIPHCPNCGSPLVPNIRINDTFVEKPWIGQYQKIIDLINANKGKHILLLEL
jgi:NAD-dependent SIR2 family protein deacetylase